MRTENIMQARTHFCYIQENVYVGRKCISSKPINAALQKAEQSVPQTGAQTCLLWWNKQLKQQGVQRHWTVQYAEPNPTNASSYEEAKNQTKWY